MAFTPGEMGSLWNVLSRGATLSSLYFRRILPAALERREQKSEDDCNISGEVMVTRARDEYHRKRLNSNCFEVRMC